MDVSVWELILRVVGAAFCGAIIGFEREMKKKSAGFLTFTLVCVGSCLISILQINVTNEAIKIVQEDAALSAAIKTDMGRIIGQVVSGIGFLGAGAIIHDKGGVRGITTAALLWLVSALGLMIGFGGKINYIIAAITVGVILPLLYVVRYLGEKLTNRSQQS